MQPQVENCAVPPWWCEELECAVFCHAQRALPNEMAGLFLRFGESRKVEFYPLVAQSSPTAFRVAEEDVVRLAFMLADQLGTVVATCHSHPSGNARWSDADNQLAEWASLHGIILVADGSYTVRFLRTSFL